MTQPNGETPKYRPPSNIPRAREMVEARIVRLQERRDAELTNHAMAVAEEDATHVRTLAEIEFEIADAEATLALMVRSSADKVTRTRHPPPNEAQVARILLLRRETDMSEQQIAVDVGTNAGRVSEVIKGLRKPGQRRTTRPPEPPVPEEPQ